jgi:hypothetical protein
MKVIDNKETMIHGELTKESFDDFVKRMHYHVRGEGVNNHATANATFIVQCKRLVSGIDKDYTDNTCLFIDGEPCFDFDDFIQDFDDEDIDDLITEGAPIYKVNGEYKCDSQSHLFDWVEDEKGCDWSATHTGYDYKWEYVNHHMTREAAEAFIKRKSHDYGELRVFVDSAYWCWELKALMDGILDGKVVFND